MTDNATAQMQQLLTELQQVGITGAATSERVVQTAPTNGIRCLNFSTTTYPGRPQYLNDVRSLLRRAEWVTEY